jgi:hypothetical protein
VAGLINGGTILEGRLILSLDSGEILDLGYVQGPQGLKGDRGAIGSVGPAGRDGNGLLHGAGVPTFDDGKDGDFFIDVKEWRCYGPKVSGKWGSGVALLPKDRGGTLPTGMKTQGGVGASRAFAAAMGGAGGGTVVTGGGNGSLQLIDIHGKPLPAGAPVLGPPPAPGQPPSVVTPATWTTVARDVDNGDAMVVDIYAESGGGSRLVEVAAMRDSAGRTGYSEVYEVVTGGAPILSFQVIENSGFLTLQMYSNVNLNEVRGRVIYI